MQTKNISRTHNGKSAKYWDICRQYETWAQTMPQGSATRHRRWRPGRCAIQTKDISSACSESFVPNGTPSENMGRAPRWKTWDVRPGGIHEVETMQNYVSEREPCAQNGIVARSGHCRTMYETWFADQEHLAHKQWEVGNVLGHLQTI